jgi:hypothetical protein
MVVLVEQQRRQALAHVEFHIVGEHAQEHMRPHPRHQPVIDRPDLQVDRLQRAKSALDLGQRLVGTDRLLRRHRRRRNAGTDNVEAVKACLRRDIGVVALPGKGVVSDADVEVLGHLVAVDHGADLEADSRRATQRCPLALDCRRDPRQGVQVLTLVPPLGGEQRVAADNQALARIRRRGDLGEATLIEQR